MESLSTADEAQVVVALRLVSSAPDIDTFVAQYGRYLHGDEIFLLTKAPSLPGTLVRFRFELAGGEPVLAGRGTVTRVHAGHPNLIPGMDVAYEPLDERSRTIFERLRRARPAPRAAAPAAAAPRRPGVPPPPPPAAMRAPSQREATSSAAPAGEPLPTADENVDAAPPMVPKLRCAVSDSLAEYLVEWSVDEAPPDRDEEGGSPPAPASWWQRVAARLSSADARGRRVIGAASLAGVVLLACVVGWTARSPSVHRASSSTAVAAAVSPRAAVAPPAPPPTASPTTAPPPTAPPRSSTSSSTSTTSAAVAPPAAAAPVVNESPVAAPATASLQIETRPSGAAVSVDGKRIGASPLAIEVARGPHQVTVTRVRYAPFTSTVDAPGTLKVKLERPPGTLLVESTPAAADVMIQGKRRGKTPLRLDVAAFKSYDVRVAFSRGKVWRQRVYLKGPTTTVQATLADASLTKR